MRFKISRDAGASSLPFMAYKNDLTFNFCLVKVLFFKALTTQQMPKDSGINLFGNAEMPRSPDLNAVILKDRIESLVNRNGK